MARRIKMSPETIKKVEKLLEQGMRQVDIAEECGITQGAVSNIKRFEKSSTLLASKLIDLGRMMGLSDGDITDAFMYGIRNFKNGTKA